MDVKIPDVIDTVEGIEPKYRALFTQRDDGRYEYKDPAALANAFRATKEKAQRDAEEAAKLRAEFEARKDIDPIKYRELIEREAELEEARRAASGEWESAKSQLKAASDEAINKARGEAESWRTRYAMDKLEGEIESKLRAKGVTEAGIKLLKPSIAQQATIEFENDRPTWKFLEGGRIKLNAEADPYSVDDFVEGYRKEYPGLFQSVGISGAGGQAGEASDLSDVGNILNWTPAKKIQYQNTYGDSAYRKAIAQAVQAKGK